MARKGRAMNDLLSPQSIRARGGSPRRCCSRGEAARGRRRGRVSWGSAVGHGRGETMVLPCLVLAGLLAADPGAQGRPDPLLAPGAATLQVRPDGRIKVGMTEA